MEIDKGLEEKWKWSSLDSKCQDASTAIEIGGHNLSHVSASEMIRSHRYHIENTRRAVRRGREFARCRTRTAAPIGETDFLREEGRRTDQFDEVFEVMMDQSDFIGRSNSPALTDASVAGVMCDARRVRSPRTVCLKPC